MIEDLGSTNGTSVNGTAITAPTVLLDGGDIALGAVKLKLKKRNPEKETLRITDAERARLHGIFS
jgi:pSer/pThr/pTyr-binding forkhead associated (FHA) protein